MEIEASLNQSRLVTYVSEEMLNWVKDEAKKLGMSESTFLRFVILTYKKNMA